MYVAVYAALSVYVVGRTMNIAMVSGYAVLHAILCIDGAGRDFTTT